MDLDLFSQQFKFSINNSREGKKTLPGQIITILIATFGLVYLAFLVNYYFGNNYLPKITETTQINTKSNSMQFEKSPFSIRFTFQGPQPAPENFVLEKYISISAQVGIALTGQLDQITLGKCKDFYPKYAHEYVDLDLCFPPGIELSYSYDEELKMYLEQGIYLTIFECMGPHCATQEEIQFFLDNYPFLMFLSFNYDEYDFATQTIVSQQKQKLMLFERPTSIFSIIYAEKTVLEVDNGYIFKNTNELQYIHGYDEDISYLSSGITSRYPQFDQIQTSVYGFFIFPIRLNNRLIKVEYPKITESLAQFISVMNAVTILSSFLIRYFTEIKIFEQIVENMVKFYYQKSLKDCKKIQEKKFRCGFNSYQHIFHQSVVWSIKNYLLNKFGFSRKSRSEKDFQKLNEKQKQFHKQTEIYENLYDVTKNQVEIDQLFKEILQLKTCVQVLLSKEQYAAVKFVGRNVPSKKEKLCYKESTLNHLEVQDLIDRNTHICQKYFHDFYININNNTNNNNSNINNQKTTQFDINERIVKSLVESTEKIEIQREILQHHGINNTNKIESKISQEIVFNNNQQKPENNNSNNSPSTNNNFPIDSPKSDRKLISPSQSTSYIYQSNNKINNKQESFQDQIFIQQYQSNNNFGNVCPVIAEQDDDNLQSQNNENYSPKNNTKSHIQQQNENSGYIGRQNPFYGKNTNKRPSNRRKQNSVSNLEISTSKMKDKSIFEISVDSSDNNKN